MPDAGTPRAAPDPALVPGPGRCDDVPMMGVDQGMTGFLIGSGWLGLLACLVLGGVATQVLAHAGRRRVQGRPWAVSGAVGWLLLAVGVAAALSSWGTFFGFMGVAFAVVTALGAVTSFTAGARAQESLREQEEHAARLGAAYARGAGSAAALRTEPPASPPPAGERPDWYTPGDPDGPARP